jgi:hypothetical protein
MKASTIRATIIRTCLLLLAGGCTSTGTPPTSIAASTAPQQMLSVDSPLGEIFDTPAALAVLQEAVPEMAGDPAAKKHIRLFSLRMLSANYPSMNQQKLATVDAELRRIPAPPPDLRGPAGDPPFRAKRLALGDVLQEAGAPSALFNGKDLTGWDVFLGPAQRVNGTYPAIGEAVGLNNDTTPIFSVQQVDGGPAIHVDGRIWGTLTTKAEYANYHLHLEYRWGDKRWPEAKPPLRNNGVLYHSQGAFGAADKTWMESIELEIIAGQVGGAGPVGADSRFRTTVGRDLALSTGSKRRFMPGGREISIGLDGFEFIDAASDAELPLGQWNSIDLYVLGDRAIHVLNGVPVMSVSNITGGKDHLPLTRGKIQLQSEGAETFFRNVSLRQIDKLPKIRVER